ncbi:hypothetical protein PISMIDRAFT_43850, partial [Pisolithus microcarpus 441]
NVGDTIQWWSKCQSMYPHLSCMALDYLCIPATSINVKHLFSKGQVLMPYLHNRLSSQTMHTLLCLGHWS